MAKKSKTPDVTRKAQWTKEEIKDYISTPRDWSLPVLRALFDWSKDESEEAANAVINTLEKQGIHRNDGGLSLPKGPHEPGPWGRRKAVEGMLINGGKGHLFRRNHFTVGDGGAPWFDDAMTIDGRAKTPEKADADYPHVTLVQLYIAAVWSRHLKGHKKEDRQERQEPARGFGRPRSGSVQSDDTLSTTGAIRNKVDKVRLDEDSGDSVVSIAEDVFDPPSKGNTKLSVLHVYKRDDKTWMRCKLVLLNSVLDASGKAHFDLLVNKFPGKHHTFHWFKVAQGRPALWKIEDSDEMEAALGWLRDQMIKIAGRDGICLFTTVSEELLNLVPRPCQLGYPPEEQEVDLDPVPVHRTSPDSTSLVPSAKRIAESYTGPPSKRPRSAKPSAKLGRRAGKKRRGKPNTKAGGRVQFTDPPEEEDEVESMDWEEDESGVGDDLMDLTYEPNDKYHRPGKDGQVVRTRNSNSAPETPGETPRKTGTPSTTEHGQVQDDGMDFDDEADHGGHQTGEGTDAGHARISNSAPETARETPDKTNIQSPSQRQPVQTAGSIPATGLNVSQSASSKPNAADNLPAELEEDNQSPDQQDEEKQSPDQQEEEKQPPAADENVPPPGDTAPSDLPPSVTKSGESSAADPLQPQASEVEHPKGQPEDPMKSAGDTNPYPFMVPFDSTANPIRKPPASQTPSINITALVDKCVLNEWISSTLIGINERLQPTENDDDPFAEDKDRESFLMSTIDLSHQTLAEGLWQLTCRIWGIDPTETDPRVGVWCIGWNKKRPLFSYQATLATFLLRELVRGRPVVMLSAGMGMGKTAITLATLLKLREYATFDFDDTPSNPTSFQWFLQHHNPDLNTPSLAPGVQMVVCQPNLIMNWVREIGRFTDSNTRPLNVVVAWTRPLQRKTRDALGEAYNYWFTPDDVVKPGDLSPSEKRCYERTYENPMPEEGVKVMDILRMHPEEDRDEKRPWQTEWLVVGSSGSLSTWVTEGFNEVEFSIIAIDEFHKTKNASAAPWQQIFQMENVSALIGISATPFTRPSDLFAIVATACKRLVKPVHGTRVYKRLKPADHAVPGMVCRKEDMSPVETSFYRRTAWGRIHLDAHKLDMYINRGEPSGDQQQQTRSKKRTSQEEENELNSAVQKFHTWLKPMIISYTPDQVWRPDPLKDGSAIVELPPHSAFDITFDIDKVYREPLERIWVKARRNAATPGLRTQFFSSIYELRVYTLFPCLLLKAETNPKLSKELGNLSNTVASAVLKDMESSQIWGCMKEIHGLKSMKALRTMIVLFRGEMNALGFPRKIILGCHKPLNATIVYMYLRWLCRQRWYKTLKTETDIAYISSSMMAADKQLVIDKFTTTNPNRDGYKDSPFILVSVSSQIKEGVSLPPADRLIQLDGDWAPRNDIQLAGRIQRMKKQQLAPFTESYRMICTSPWCPLGEWQANRHSRMEDVRKWIAEYGGETTEEPLHTSDVGKWLPWVHDILKNNPTTEELGPPVRHGLITTFQRSGLKDLLKTDGWVNDDHINHFFEWLGLEYHVSTVSPQNTSTYYREKNWAQDDAQRSIDPDVLTRRLVLIPMNIGNYHWVLLVLNPVNKVLQFLDSCTSSVEAPLEVARTFVNHFGGNWDDWRFDDTIQSVRQKNACDCGVFTCMNALAAVRGIRFSSVPSETGMADSRGFICAVIMTGSVKALLNGFNPDVHWGPDR